MFATCGQQVDIWDEERTEPVRSFNWGVDSINSVKFNPVEVSVFVHLNLVTKFNFLLDYLESEQELLSATIEFTALSSDMLVK